MDQKNKIYDVVVLGGGLMSGTICSILSKNNIDTLMIDNSCHPKFAIGEALVPESSFMFKYLAKKYDIPELDSFSSHWNIMEHISPTSGVKRALSTIYQEEGGSVDIVQIPAISPPLGPDAHLFRQDTDAYICHAAVKYGTSVLHNTQIKKIDIAEDIVKIELADGGMVNAKYIIDAGGKNSVVADTLGVRNEGDFKTNSRAIFTHMVGVEFVDKYLPREELKTCNFALAQGTLHHIFDGGWFWIIPFGNHPKSTNKVCSVGLVLDNNKYPYTGKDPKEEFYEFAKKSDSLMKQLEGAQTVRPWIGSKEKLQYSIDGAPVGERWALVGPAAAFVDPLYSPGINTTLNFINCLIPRVINSVKNDDYSLDNYKCVVDDWKNSSMMWDKMIHASYIAFRSSKLWRTWFRLWNVFGFTGNVLITNMMLQYYATGDKTILDRKYEYPMNGPFASRLEPCLEMFEKAYELMTMVEDGTMSEEAVIDKLHILMEEQKFFPFPKFHRKSYTKNSLPNNTMLDMLWQVHVYRAKLPKELKPYFTQFSLFKMYIWAFKELFKIPKAKLSALFGFVSDIFIADKRFSKQLEKMN